MKMKYLLTILFVLLAVTGFCQTSYEVYADPGNIDFAVGSDVTPITNPQLHANRVNLVFLADGYADTPSEFNEFMAQKEAAMYQMFTDPINSPYPQYRSHFNVYWVWVAGTTSGQSGLGCPGGSGCTHNSGEPPCLPEVNTHFDSRRDAQGWHRFTLPHAPGAVLDIVQGGGMFNNTTSPLSISVLANSEEGSVSQNAYLNQSGGGANQFVNGTETGIHVVASVSDLESYEIEPQNPTAQ